MVELPGYRMLFQIERGVHSKIGKKEKGGRGRCLPALLWVWSKHREGDDCWYREEAYEHYR